MARNRKEKNDEWDDDWSNDFRDGKRKNRYSERQQYRRAIHSRRDERFNELMRVDDE